MKKVLVVEDELSIANFLTDLIQILGYECKLLTSGKEVLDLAKTWKPDLITLDLAMPSPDGLQVLSMLKADGETKSIPVFVVSAIVNQPEIHRQLTAAHSIFQKPLDTKSFMQAVQKICNP